MLMARTFCKLPFAALFIFFSIVAIPAYADEEQRMAGTVPVAEAPQPDEEDVYRQLNLFGEVFERVRAYYVDETVDEDLIESAINGMLVNLDPHSAYLDEDGFTEMKVQTRGEFGGLGIEVTMENGLVKVVSPIDDTPAFRAGVQAGDFITHLDDQPVLGLTLSEAVDKMRGRVGTAIDLTIRRPDVQEPVEVTIVRDVIKISAVRHKVLDGQIGYIRVTTFNQNTDTGVEKAIKEFKEELGEDLKGYILDLRNNPGGLLDQAIAVADIFLDKGEIVSTRGRNASDTKRDNATPGDLTDGAPLILLINGGSASASEIVAGALKDHRRGIVMGTTSFGKGSVQTVIPLPGHGAMRLTTARYYTPSGHSIQAKGIEPDIVVELAKIEQFDVKQYRESDLRGALENPEAHTKDASEENEAEESATPADENAEESEEIKDYQLLRAMDLIRGISLYDDRLEQRKYTDIADTDTVPVPEVEEEGQ